MLSSPLTMRRSSRTPQPSANQGDAIPRSGPPRSCYVAVLGCSGPRADSVSGVGKSSLCARFVNPGLDAYNAVKPGPDESVLAWMDFVEPEINQDHFVYYGSSARRLSGNTTAVIHVIEQTEFLDDAAVGNSAYPVPGTYLQRATMRYLQSPGKVAYTKRANIGAGITSGAKRFPTALSNKGISGYILVYDPTARDNRKQQQLTLLARLAEKLPQDLPLALAITKCDSLTPGQLTRLTKEHEELARCLQNRNQVIPCIHISADMGINVDLLFMFLASRALDVEFQVDVSDYEVSKIRRHSEIRDLQRELSGAVMDLTQQFQTRWHPVYNVLRRMPAYRRLSDLVGYEGVRRLFLARLLEIKMEDVKKIDISAVPLDQDGATDGDCKENGEETYQRVSYDELEQSLHQHPDVKSDSKAVAEIYEDLETVREARTWPRQSTASVRNRDSHRTVYFPVSLQSPQLSQDEPSGLASPDLKQRHGSCPTFRKGRPMSLVIDGQLPSTLSDISPNKLGSQMLDDMPEKLAHSSPRLNNKSQNRPRSVSPRGKAMGLLDRLRLSPSHSASSSSNPTPDPPAPAPSVQHLEVRHTRSHSLQTPSNAISPSHSMPTVAGQPMTSQSSMSPAKSLPYLPIVIPFQKPNTTRHVRSSSIHNPLSVSTVTNGSAKKESPLSLRKHSSGPISSGQNQQPYAQYGASNIYSKPVRKTGNPGPKDVPSPIYRELEAAAADLGESRDDGVPELAIEVDAPAPLYAELETPGENGADEDLLVTLV